MSSFIRSVVTGACTLVSVFTLSAATNLATDAGSKRTITMVQGKVVKGSLGNAFNGADGWAAAYGLFSASTEGNVAPSEETPVVFDFTFNDDYRPGEDLGVTRFTVSGLNNYWHGGVRRQDRLSEQRRVEFQDQRFVGRRDVDGARQFLWLYGADASHHPV